MIIFIIALLVISLLNSKLYFKDFNKDAFSRETTTSVKGFFALLIFESHVRDYINMSNKFYDTSYVFILNHIGQLMVVMFLFYSGYGIITQFKNRPNYFVNFPKNRILKTYLNLPLVVLLFLLTNLCIGTLNNYSTSTILLSLTGWTAIGNSNWFLFSIIVTYAFVYFASLISKNEKTISYLSLVFVFTFSIVLSYLRPTYFYNTILSLPAGMLFASYKDNFEKLVTKNNLSWFLCLLGFGLVFAFLYSISYFVPFAQIVYNLQSIAFALVITILSYKIKIGNKILVFLGVNSLAIYLLQRIPMMFLQTTKLTNLPILLALCALAITLVISYGYTILFGIIDKMFFQKNKSDKKSKL